MKPITPQEITKTKKNSIPPEVIEAFNELIVQNYNGWSSKVIQEDVVNRIIKKVGILRQEVFDKNYLEIDDIFRKAGWKVTYDKPGYNETYKAYWVFEAPSREIYITTG